LSLTGKIQQVKEGIGKSPSDGLEAHTNVAFDCPSEMSSVADGW
jgi:hypothetical protein